MKRLFFLLCLGWSSHLLANEAAPLADNPAVERRLIAISEEMRCLVCQNESLAGSHAELALDLRRELRELIVQGQSDAQIEEFMVSRYGDFVLYRPRWQARTWLLWAGPFALLLLGIGLLISYVSGRNRNEVTPLLNAQDHLRVAALLKKETHD